MSCMCGKLNGRPFRITGDLVDERGHHITVSSSALKTRDALTSFLDSVGKATVMDLHGGINSIATGQTLTTLAPVNVTIGISKILLVINAGFDKTGTITITGTSVDRDTGATTGSDTEDILVDGQTTDNSAAGTELATLYDLSDAYLSSKWWTGALTLSTAVPDSVALSDLDVYTLAFEQFGDVAGVTVQAIDNTIFASTATSDFEVQAYTLTTKDTPTANAVDLDPVANFLVTSPTLNRYYRLRRGALGLAIDGSAGDGFFMQAKAGSNRTYTNWTNKVWYTVGLTT